MAVHLFTPKYRVDECLEQIRECLEVGWTGLGFKTQEFEKAWCDYTNFPHSHFLNSATAGLHLSTLILRLKYGWDDDDEIITTPLTFVSTNHAIRYSRLTPVFADVDEYLCLDPDSVRRSITAKTRAVIFVGFGGNAGRYSEIAELCREKGLALILDAAHMAGTLVKGETPGRDADAVVYSFQAVKNLPTADAGMVCFRDPEDDRLARELSWLGIDKDTYSRSGSSAAYKWRYDVNHVGFKYHGNSIMAAIGLVQLRYLNADNAYRREIANVYDELLGCEETIRLVPIAPDCTSSRHLYPIVVDGRDDLIQQLNQFEIYPGVHYRDNAEYAVYAGFKANCQSAASYSKRLLSLPLHLRMTLSDANQVADRLVKLMRQRRVESPLRGHV